VPASREWFEKDFYSMLGVSETADSETIKRAFKKLARDFHPDRNPGDKAAEDRFKEISEAYDVLGNHERKAEYDQVRQLQRSGYASGGPGGFQTGGVRFEDLPFDISDLFGGMFSGGRAGRGRRGVRMDPFADETPEIPREERRTVRVPYHLAALGGQIRVPVADGKVTMKVPAGTQPGTTLRLRGKGHRLPDGTNADVLVEIAVAIPTQVDEREKELLEEIAALRRNGTGGSNK
jgi:molecular chaperone DnaJ